MSRSLWKGTFSRVSEFNLPQASLSPSKADLSLSKKTQNERERSLRPPKQSDNALKAYKVWSRGSTVLPWHIGKEYHVYNGKNWTLVRIIEDMVGHKFGEFSSTKKITVHKLQRKKQASRKKLS